MPVVKSPRPLPPTIDRLCLGLADPTRLQLLMRIGHGEVCVCDLQVFVGRAQPTVSRHLSMLRKCGLVTRRKAGRWCHYRRACLPAALARLVDLAAPPRLLRNSPCCVIKAQAKLATRAQKSPGAPG